MSVRPLGSRRSDRYPVAHAIGLGGKDLYRQARAVWRVARTGDPRARSGLVALDAGTKTIHAAYKDLRRRDRFTAGFRPTPYDVWPFRTTARSASRTPARSLRRSSRIPSIITRDRAPWWSIRWPAEARPSTSASRWDVAVWRMTSTRCVQKSRSTT